MRNAFAKELQRLGQTEPRLLLLSGDIGNKLFDGFKEACPGRFFNCGVAEANMIGVAAGLARSGWLPVTYTITPFTTYRCLEQIRVDVCYHEAPVVIVGTGAGLAYAELGPTHHSCEEMAMLRALPNMRVFAPADAAELRAVLRAIVASPGPSYIRIGKKGEPLVHTTDPVLEIGRALPVRDGQDVCLLSTGVVLPAVLELREALAARGISAAVKSFPTVKPLDQATLQGCFERYPVVATFEEHSTIGGFGGAVAEWLVDQGVLGARLLRFGTRDEFLHRIGSQEWARAALGFDKSRMEQAIADAVATSRAPVRRRAGSAG
jgi:transketolase